MVFVTTLFTSTQRTSFASSRKQLPDMLNKYVRNRRFMINV